MSSLPRSRKASRSTRGRKAAGQARRNSLRWLAELVASAWRKRKGLPVPAVRIEPACEAEVEQPLSQLAQQCKELGARLLVHDPALHVVRNLFVVHDELGLRGWAGVEALPIKIVGRALAEAEIMASDESSPVLESIIDSLRDLKTAAEARAAEEALEREWETLQVPEVSDTNFGEFEMAERSWAGTVPANLDLPPSRV
jgi:hypothetical protein